MADNSFKVKNSLVLSPIDLATLTNPQAGDLACDSNDSNKIKRYDAASSAWTEVGSGGVGSVDIMFVQDFESASLATFVSPTDVVLSTTDPLHGRVSAILTHDASVNKSFKQIIPVDRKFRGQAIVLDLNVKSAASAGNVTIKITDESAPADLIASEQLQLSNDVSGRRSSVSFTIPSTCSSLSYTITALPEAGSPVTRIDDIVAMLSDVSLLETSVEVPNMTAWQGYTPTFQGFGTAPTGPTNVEFEWRQVGENVEIRGKFTSGVSTAVEARIGLPAGLTSAGTSLIPSLQQIGTSTYSGTVAGAANTILIEPSVSYVTIGVNSGGLSGLTKANANALFSSGQAISLFASVPCSGLSATTTKTIPLTQSGLVQESDSYLLVSGNGGQALTAGTTNIPFANIQSNKGDAFSFNGTQLTVLKDGTFSFSATIVLNAGVTNRVGIYKNGINISTSGSIVSSNIHSYSISLNLSQNDIISFRLTDTNATLSNSGAHTLQATYQGSLKQVSVSSDQKITIPTSELRFTGSSSRGTADSGTRVKFDTLASIRGDAFTVTNDATGTMLTIKKKGILSVNANLVTASATYAQIISSGKTVSAFDVSGDGGSGSWDGTVNIGDIVYVIAGLNPNGNVAISFNAILQEQDISVSVTNTLPQFSESDSYVSVNTTTARGSTATSIPRFSNVSANIGTDVTYLDSDVDGASFTAISDGLYNVSFTYESSLGGQQRIGITKNLNVATNGATPVDSLTPATGLLSMSADAPTGGDVNTQSTSVSVYLLKGDVVRPHVQAAANPSNTAHSIFHISKVGKPNVTGVDVTPFIEIPQQDSQFLRLTGGSAAVTTDITNFVISENSGSSIVTYTSNGRITALKETTVDVTFVAVQATASADFYVVIQKNGSNYIQNVASRPSATGGYTEFVSTPIKLFTGDYLTFRTGGIGNTGSYVHLKATAASDQILTAPETFSTDTASLAYSSSYTLATLNTAPVGTYITFTYAANTNTRTQTATRPTQTDADMNANGILLYTRVYNAPSTAAQPACIAIQIGKGLKGKSLDLYKSAGKVTGGSLDFTYVTSQVSPSISHTKLGAFVHYNELSGVLLIDAGLADPLANFSAIFVYSDTTTATSGYLVINASKNPSIVGMNIERVSARAVNSAGTSIANTGETAFVFDSTKSFDTHGALNTSTGVFTAPESGYYSYSAAILANSLAYTVANAVIIRAYKNSSNNISQFYWSAQTTSAVPANVQGSDIVFLAKGDTLEFRLATNRAGGAVTLNTASVFNFISIAKVNIGGRN